MPVILISRLPISSTTSWLSQQERGRVSELTGLPKNICPCNGIYSPSPERWNSPSSLAGRAVYDPCLLNPCLTDTASELGPDTLTLSRSDTPELALDSSVRRSGDRWGEGVARTRPRRFRQIRGMRCNITFYEHEMKEKEEKKAPLHVTVIAI